MIKRCPVRPTGGAEGHRKAPSTPISAPRQCSDAVAPVLQCTYGPVMMLGLHASWPAWVVRLLMLILGTVATPSVGLEAMQRPHCVQHEQTDRRLHQVPASSTMGHGHQTEAWTQRHDHQCTHCPASECTRVAPCAGSSAIAVAPPHRVVRNLEGHRVTVDLGRQPIHSVRTTPDTPPPQLIA